MGHERDESHPGLTSVDKQTARDVRTSIKAHAGDKHEMGFSNGGDVERTVDSMREFVALSVEETIRYRQFGGRQATWNILHIGLRKFA